MNNICPKCWESEKIIKNWKSWDFQKYKCKTCWNNFLESKTNDSEEKTAENSSLNESFSEKDINISKEEKKVVYQPFLVEDWKNKIRAQFEDFINEQESIFWIWETEEVAKENLLKEFAKIKKWRFKSNEAKYVSFRNNYRNIFDKPKFSKKYWFEFNSWAEYWAKKYESKKK